MADSRVLEIIIKAVDKVGPGVAGAQSGLGKLQGGLAGVGKVAGVVGGALAAVGAVDYVRGSVAAARESEAASARVRAAVSATGAVYDKMAPTIDAAISKHSMLAAVDDEELGGALANLTTITGNAAGSIDNLGLVTDLARAKNISLEAASNLVGKVMNGNYGAMKKLGIEIEKGTSVTDALGQVQSRVAGQAEAFGNTSEGAAQKMQVALGNLQETVGSKLLPVITPLVEKLAEMIQKLSETGALDSFAQLLGDIATVAADIVGWYTSLNKEQQDLVLKAALAVAALAPIISTLGSIAGGISGAATAVSSISGLFASGGALAGVTTFFSGLGTSIAGIGTAIAGATGVAAGALVALAGAVGFGIGSLLNKLEPVKKAQDWLGKKLGNAIYDTSEAFRKAGPVIGGAVDGIGKRITGFIDRVKRGFDSVVDAVRNLPRTIATGLTNLLSAIRPIIARIVERLSYLNPFQRHSPSLVDNVLAGTRVIANAYGGLSGMSIGAPSIAMPALAGVRAGGMVPQEVRVYLDGRELNRGLAKTSSAVARSGAK